MPILTRFKTIKAKSGHVRITKKSVVGRSTIEDHVQFGPMECHIDNLLIGRGTYSSDVRVLGFCDTLRIGRYCSFGSGITIVGGEGRHLPDRISTYPFPMLAPFHDVPVESVYPAGSSRKGNVVIGHDVWIGHSAVITEGISIGNGAVIAIGSIVTKDVPSYAVVAGNPATVKKMRHDADTVALLERLEWWDWPAEKIKSNIALFSLTGEELKKALQERL